MYDNIKYLNINKKIDSEIVFSVALIIEIFGKSL